MSRRTSSSSEQPDMALSAAKRVYIELRQRILDMNLLPGTRIVEREIAAEHGVSRTPVHEAVQRLAEEGLIEVVERVGTFVARIPLNQLEEAMLVRTALEIAIVEKAAQRIAPEGIKRLREILTEQHVCCEANDRGGFHRTDEAFHEILAEIAGFPGVWRMIQQAKIQIDRYRWLTLPMSGRMDHVVGEHEKIVAALEAGRSDLAVHAMHEHLDLVLPAVEIARSLRPDYFIHHFPPTVSGAAN